MLFLVDRGSLERLASGERLAPGTLNNLIKELRGHVKDGAPWSLSFKPTGKLSKKEVEQLEAALKDSFERWAESWIFPWLALIERAATPRRKRVQEMEHD